MDKTNALQIFISFFFPLLFNCAILNAGSMEKNNQKTAYDFYLHGNASYHNGQYGKAITAFRKSVELDPNYYYAHINLGVALVKAQEFNEAIQKFTFCINKKWGSGADQFVLYFNRALAWKEIGQTRSALRDQATLKKLDPVRVKELQNSKDYILMDTIYVETRNEADKNRLFNRYKTSITKGKIVLRKIADFGKTAEEYEAMGLIEGTLEEVSSVLADYESYPKFMPNVNEIKIKSSTDEEIIVDYKLLLPMDFVKKYRLKFWSKNEENKIQLFWKKLPWPGLKPKETIIDTYGQWILEDFPEKDNQVLAYYRVYTDPGKIPLGTGWIVDILTQKSVPNIISKTRSRVKSIFY